MMDLQGLPGLAEVAMQSGAHAARVIRSRVEGRNAPRPFRLPDLGTMAAVSRTSAVASFRGLEFSGRLGWLIWLLVHLVFLTGFKNRVTTVVHWAITFVGRARAERTIAADHVAIDHRGQRPSERPAPPASPIEHNVGMALAATSASAIRVGPLLHVQALTVRFGAFLALDGVDFEIRPGETVALAGENGAGKSTLVRCIAGDIAPSSGRIEIAGSRIVSNPAAVSAAGVAVVWQDLARATPT